MRAAFTPPSGGAVWVVLFHFFFSDGAVFSCLWVVLLSLLRFGADLLSHTLLCLVLQARLPLGGAACGSNKHLDKTTIIVHSASCYSGSFWAVCVRRPWRILCLPFSALGWCSFGSSAPSLEVEMLSLPGAHLPFRFGRTHRENEIRTDLHQSTETRSGIPQ